MEWNYLKRCWLFVTLAPETHTNVPFLSTSWICFKMFKTYRFSFTQTTEYSPNLCAMNSSWSTEELASIWTQSMAANKTMTKDVREKPHGITYIYITMVRKCGFWSHVRISQNWFPHIFSKVTLVLDNVGSFLLETRRLLENLPCKRFFGETKVGKLDFSTKHSLLAEEQYIHLVKHNGQGSEN